MGGLGWVGQQSAEGNNPQQSERSKPPRRVLLSCATHGRCQKILPLVHASSLRPTRNHSAFVPARMDLCSQMGWRFQNIDLNVLIKKIHFGLEN